MRTCKHCGRNTVSTDDVARTAGWRWYSGPTVGGGHLDDVICPVCAGVAEPTAEAWDVECVACDWSYSGDLDDDAGADDILATAKQAVAVGRDHQCDPVVRLRTPEGTWVRLEAFDRDGNLREAAVAT